MSELETRLKALAQKWRDKAFGSQHMSQLQSDTLEECAGELDALLGAQETEGSDHERSE